MKQSKRRRTGRSKKPASKTPNKKIAFEIQTIDPLGQGVFKQDSPSQKGTITFIAKTLPGEKGIAKLYKSSKGVQFASLEKLELEAPNRIEPQCPHFNQCPACDYLHTDYDSELAYKRAALAKRLDKFSVSGDDITVKKATERLAYRNRMQLHYRHKYIGLIDAQTDQVLEIPECKIIRDELRPAFDRLYKDKSWTKEHTGNGHCELYLSQDGVSIEWDKPYAHGGFTQVNEAMNLVLRQQIVDYLKDDSVDRVLDLFSGQGNLSDDILADHHSERVMVDLSPVLHEDFIRLNLFDDTALRGFKAQCKIKQFDVVLVDPPRKGFPLLNQWIKQYKPKKLIYVSCNAATMVRDLQNLSSNFTLENVALIDLFPGTQHFETVVSISFKKH